MATVAVATSSSATCSASRRRTGTREWGAVERTLPRPGSCGRVRSRPRGEFRPLSGRAKWVSFLLMVGAVLALVGILSTWSQIGLINRAVAGVAIGEEEAQANDVRQSIIGLIQLIVQFTTAVSFAMWF